jgi:hypothetical protein
VDARGCNFKGERVADIGHESKHDGIVRVGASGFHYASSPLALMNPVFDAHFSPFGRPPRDLRFLEIADVGTKRDRNVVRWMPPNADHGTSQLEVISDKATSSRRPAIEFYKMATNHMIVIRELSYTEMLALCTGYVDVANLGRVWFSNGLFGHCPASSTPASVVTGPTGSAASVIPAVVESKECKGSDTVGVSSSSSSTSSVSFSSCPAPAVVVATTGAPAAPSTPEQPRPTIEYLNNSGDAWLDPTTGLLHRDEALGPAYTCYWSGGVSTVVQVYAKNGKLFRCALDSEKKLLPAAVSLTGFPCKRLTVYTIAEGTQVAADVLPAYQSSMGTRLIRTGNTFGLLQMFFLLTNQAWALD